MKNNRPSHSADWKINLLFTTSELDIRYEYLVIEKIPKLKHVNIKILLIISNETVVRAMLYWIWHKK